MGIALIALPLLLSVDPWLALIPIALRGAIGWALQAPQNNELMKARETQGDGNLAVTLKESVLLVHQSAAWPLPCRYRSTCCQLARGGGFTGNLVAAPMPANYAAVRRSGLKDRTDPPHSSILPSTACRIGAGQRSAPSSIKHCTIKVRRPHSNVFVERLHRTLLNEHFHIQGRTKWYEALKEMQADLDDYLVIYNTTRPHQGRNKKGLTPYAVFKKGFPNHQKSRPGKRQKILLNYREPTGACVRRTPSLYKHCKNEGCLSIALTAQRQRYHASFSSFFLKA